MSFSRYIDGSRVVYWDDTTGNLTVPGAITASTFLGASFSLGPSVQFSSIQCSSINAGAILNGANTATLTYTDTTAPASDGKVNGISITNLNQRVRPSYGEQLLFTSSMSWTTWASRTPAANYGWRHVAWSPTLKMYCAVASDNIRNNNIMTSPDGINWTLRTYGVTTALSTVIWADTIGRFVAIGDNGVTVYSLYSSDGINWSVGTISTNAFWIELAWSPQLTRMVAVGWRGSTPSIAYSSDGASWTVITPGVTSRWYGICWSAELGLFAALSPFADAGANRCIMTSPDGITWTQRLVPATKDWFSIAWSGELGLFAAVSRSGDTLGVMTSSDGVNWTLRSTPAFQFAYIIWSPELSMFVASNQNNASLLVSRDGVTWTSYPVLPTARQIYGMVWSREQSKLVVVDTSTGAPGSYVFTSEPALPASQNTLLFASPGYASVNNSTGLISMSSMNISSATFNTISQANVGNISTLNTQNISSAVVATSTINTNTISSAIASFSTINTNTLIVNVVSTSVANVDTLNATTVSSAVTSTSTINTNTISSAVASISTINTRNISSAIVTTSTISLNNTRTILGSNAGATNPGNSIVAVGYLAGQSNQGSQAIAVGYTAGKISQNGNSVAIGYEAGFSNQGAGGIAIGFDAGYENQGNDSVSIGTSAGYTSQGSNTVAIGFNAAGDTQGIFAVAIGNDAGFISQGSNAVSLGYYAGRQNQGVNAISIGASAGKVNQATNAVAIGYDAGKSNQSPDTVAVGVASGSINQASNAIAVGGLAGYSNQASNAVAIGNYAGYQSQGIQAVAIGSNAGRTSQGSNAIAIGNGAGETNQVANSIIINASNTPLNAATNAGFYVNPVRSATAVNVMYYDTSTKEMTYSSPPAVSVVSTFNSLSTGTASIGALNVSSIGGFSPINIRDAVILNSSLTASSITSAVVNASTLSVTSLNVSTIQFVGQYQKTFSVTLSSNVNSYVELCSLQQLQYTSPIEIRVCMYNGTDQTTIGLMYMIGSGYNQTVGSWQECLPLIKSKSDSTNITNEDVTIDINNQGSGVTSFRLRRRGTTPFTTAFTYFITLTYYEIPSLPVGFIDLTSNTGSNSATQIYNGTSLTQYQGRVGIKFVNPTTYDLTLANNSAAKPTSDLWTISSDRRIKDDIQPANLDVCYSTIKALKLSYFKYKDEYVNETQEKDRHVLGFIAQDVSLVLSKSVTITPHQEFTFTSTIRDTNHSTQKSTIWTSTLDNFYSLNADQIYKLQFGATQKLIELIETQASKISTLEAKVALLSA